MKDKAANELFALADNNDDNETDLGEFAKAIEMLGYNWESSLVKAVFRKLDYSGNGLLDLTETKGGICLIVGAQLYKEMDKDGNGNIHIWEFLKKCARLRAAGAAPGIRRQVSRQASTSSTSGGGDNAPQKCKRCQGRGHMNDSYIFNHTVCKNCAGTGKVCDQEGDKKAREVFESLDNDLDKEVKARGELNVGQFLKGVADMISGNKGGFAELGFMKPLRKHLESLQKRVGSVASTVKQSKAKRDADKGAPADDSDGFDKLLEDMLKEMDATLKEAENAAKAYKKQVAAAKRGGSPEEIEADRALRAAARISGAQQRADVQGLQARQMISDTFNPMTPRVPLPGQAPSDFPELKEDVSVPSMKKGTLGSKMWNLVSMYDKVKLLAQGGACNMHDIYVQGAGSLAANGRYEPGPICAGRPQWKSNAGRWCIHWRNLRKGKATGEWVMLNGKDNSYYYRCGQDEIAPPQSGWQVVQGKAGKMPPPKINYKQRKTPKEF